MDVRCEKCQTEYEFDDTKVPVAGLSVKCSQCSHVFWVQKSEKASAPKSAGAASGQAAWRLRQPSGKTFGFDDWSTLQRWVVERKATRDDRVSKKGGEWTRLGDIPELASFFQAVEARAKAQPAAKEWHLDDQVHAPELDQVFRAPRRRGSATWIFTALTLAAAGVAAVAVMYPELVEQWLGRSQGAEHIKAGFSALSRDTAVAVDEAVLAFQNAQSKGAHAQALAGLSQADLRRAELLRNELRSMGATDEEEGAARRDIEARRKQLDQRATRALQLAEKALGHDPECFEGHRALADYYRFVGDADKLDESVQKALTLRSQDAELELIRGLYAATQEDGHKAAKQYFERALALDAKSIRARYALARLLFDTGDLEASQQQLQFILQAVPEHVEAQALMDQLASTKEAAVKKVEAVAQPTRDTPKTMGFADVVARAHRLRESDQAERALELYNRALEMDADDPEVQTGMGYCYLDLGNAAAAIRKFQTALSLSPRYSDAHIGLAESYRIKGMKRDAAKHYRKYLEILPEGPEAPVARRMLKRLE